MRILFLVFFLFFPYLLHAEPTDAELSVWVNEAIVTTYTFDYKHYLAEQKRIAYYFSSNAWEAYSTALTSSNLLATIQKNGYYVSAVAQSTPVINKRGPGVWEAKMPIIVVYRNDRKEVKQTLQITINFATSTANTGIRGLQIESFVSNEIKPYCECDL